MEHVEVVTQEQKKEKQEKKKKPWKGIVGGVLILLAFFAIQIAISMVASSVYMVYFTMQLGGDMEMAKQLYMEKLTQPDFMTGLQLTITISSIVVALLWYKFGLVKKYTSVQWTELKQRVFRGRIVAMLTLAAVACYCLAILLADVIAVLIPGSMDTFSNIMGTALSGNKIVVDVIIVLLAPIAEELIFRGIIFQTLTRNNCSVVVAIIIQAVLFGIYHLNVMQGLYVLPLAVVLGYTAYKCKSVLPCIFIHMVNNLMSLIWSLLLKNAPIKIITIVVLVICVVAVYSLGKSGKKQTA